MTWYLPPWLDNRLPHINIEGSAAAADRPAEPDEPVEREPAPV